MTYHKIGEPVRDDNPAVFELVIEDHVPFVDPKQYGLEYDGINPKDYFITSGDAVEKAKVLQNDLWHHAGYLKKQIHRAISEKCQVSLKEAQRISREKKYPESLKNFGDYVTAVWQAAGKSRSMLNALMKAKGDNCFLETEWDNHTLLCIPKNPRKKP